MGRLDITLVTGELMQVWYEDCKTIDRVSIDGIVLSDFGADVSKAKNLYDLRKICKMYMDDKEYKELYSIAESKGYDLDLIAMMMGPTEDARINVLLNYADLRRDVAGDDEEIV